ncbi:putative 3-hydroxyacyl-thioester dehydratase [Gordonia araii NBRC 100433]|uniref:Putative 3-hydroxyacyl-thioester dehydratase n=1 Tax=Gordonia araii NBRC 100433 TaxID=1073574 RepID=G7H675_9ACTN|nr:MaoC family dehydratase [Gordonia araii]NNG96032.1 MaoC family dehydratase [Gordonia araii NBRC 100433]GAB11350.1 putative 3-hydroxyacyl-thioester dehydratase [Gordonia araii NBRC 100433]
MSRTFTSLDEARAAIGEEIGPSSPLVIDQERINAFADATGDHQWIHVDPERAKAGPFGTPIAHGFLTLSLIPLFGADLFNLDFGGARINYGANKVRFPSPVPVDSSLTATATFTDLSESAAGAVLTVKYVVSADGAAKPACVAETLVVITP